MVEVEKAQKKMVEDQEKEHQAKVALLKKQDEARQAAHLAKLAEEEAKF